ncbi:unnamed protein product [Dracunculus medinensis]|uniref:G_PROTEIN_RECEP_F1_2 domain-containing protein n=1 Tax=Dracunculus medinensis TaxID=318479 RepID=A0A158Q4N3_DRAME|nr:unnamed protein product [Dracunculus medinensis]
MNCPEDPKLFDDNDTTIIFVLTGLTKFRSLYGLFHPYISFCLCIFGFIANSIHIWVLTRPRMIVSSVHTVLICIALADIGTMSSYTLYLLRYEFNRIPDNGYPYIWVMFLMAHVVVSIALHAISLYLVVLMAFIRVRSIQARSTAACIFFFIFVLCIPTFLAHEIHEQSDNNSLDWKNKLSRTDRPETAKKYIIGFSGMVLQNNCALLKINLWLTGIVLKVVPCVLLSGLTILLLLKLQQNKRKRARLLGMKNEKGKENGPTDRTTYMLLLMVSVFLATELPQGVIAILNAIFTSQFHLFIYLTLADVLDLLSLINCYVGFTVYFCTCSKYRNTLYSLLPSKWYKIHLSHNFLINQAFNKFCLRE